MGQVFRELEGLHEPLASTNFLKAKTPIYHNLLEGEDDQIAAQMLRSIHVRVSQSRATSDGAPARLQNSLMEVRRLFAALMARDKEAVWCASYGHGVNAQDADLEILRQSRAGSHP